MVSIVEDTRSLDRPLFMFLPLFSLPLPFALFKLFMPIIFCSYLCSSCIVRSNFGSRKLFVFQ